MTVMQISIPRQILDVQKDLSQGQHNVNTGQLEEAQKVVNRSVDAIASLKAQIEALKNQVAALENGCEGLRLRVDIRSNRDLQGGTIKTAGFPLPQDLLFNVANFFDSSDVAQFACLNKEARDLKRVIILDTLANCTEITPFEFDANKQLLGKKNIVPELETRVLPPLASMVTD